MDILKTNIEGITLLSIEEARRLPKWILAKGSPWWLRSPGKDWHRDCAAVVGGDGSVYSDGFYILCNSVCVRPAIEIKNLPINHNLKIGDLVEILGKKAQYVGDDMVLLCEPIGFHRFNKYSNDYEISEVKNFVENWLKEEMTK